MVEAEVLSRSIAAEALATQTLVCDPLYGSTPDCVDDKGGGCIVFFPIHALWRVGITGADA